jgi:excisionase family DNA binding protein
MFDARSSDMTIRELIAQARAEEHVSITQLALLLQVSPETIRRAIKAGAIPTLKVGRQVRIHREKALHAFAQRGNQPLRNTQEWSQVVTSAEH